MGLMDKARDAALQARDSAEKLAQQGEAKVAEVQHWWSGAQLYRALGEAYYAEQRRGGNHEAVVAALTALDRHFAAEAAKPSGDGGPVA